MIRTCSEPQCGRREYQDGKCYGHWLGIYRRPRPPAVGPASPPIFRPHPLTGEPVELTARQAEILVYIEAEYLRTGLPPVVREIMQRFGIKSPNGVMCHIRSLRRKGFLHPSSLNHLNVRIRPVVPEGCCPCCRRPLEPLPRPSVEVPGIERGRGSAQEQRSSITSSPLTDRASSTRRAAADAVRTGPGR